MISMIEAKTVQPTAAELRFDLSVLTREFSYTFKAASTDSRNASEFRARVRDES